MGTIYTDLNSDFPDKVSTMTRVQDVSAAMKPYVDEYYTHYNRGDFDSANGVITAHPELLNMIINAKIFNDLRDEIIATQRVFKDDVESYIFSVVKNKGSWNASVKYIKYNVVFYIIDSVTLPFLAIADDIPIGTIPTNKDYWYPLAVKGEKGESGIGLSFEGAWDANITYNKDSAATYNNSLYASNIDNNVSNTPSKTSIYWTLVVDFNTVTAFDNSQSGSTETTVQGALDELYSITSASTNNIANNQTNISANTSAISTISSSINTINSKLNGIESGAQKNTITGIKGNAETTYRTGQVNITPANIGLGNVNNTADANKSVNYATSAGSAASATTAGTCTGNSATATRADTVDGYHIQVSTTALTPGSSSLTTNVLYFVYE